MRLCRILTAIAVLFLVACKSTTPPPTSQGNQPPPVQYEQGPQAPGMGPRTFTPGVPVAPIQHNPFTITTNDPAVTVPVQQPVSITTTNAIALIAHGLISTTNTENGMLNIRSTGAVGNGIVDDKLAFSTACAISQHVFIPQGTYKLSDTILVTSNVIISGVGQNKSIVVAPTGKPAFKFSNAFAYYDTGLRDMTINGGSLGAGVLATNCNYMVIENVEFAQCTPYAMNLNGVSVGNIWKNFVWGMPHTNDVGLLLSNGSGFNVIGNHFNTGAIALELPLPPNGQSFLNNVFEGNFIGIEIPLQPAKAGILSFVGNFFESCTWPLQIGNTGSGFAPGPISFIGNEFAATGNGPVIIDGAYGLTFTGNRLKPTLTFGTNVVDLVMGQNDLQNLFTNNATYADRTVGNLTANGNVAMGGYLWGTNNTPVRIHTFPTINARFGHASTNVLTIESVDDTGTNALPAREYASSWLFNGRPFQLQLTTDQNLLFNSSGGKIVVSTANDAISLYEPLQMYADTMFFFARPITFGVAPNENISINTSGGAVTLTTLNDLGTLSTPLNFYSTSNYFDAKIFGNGGISSVVAAHDTIAPYSASDLTFTAALHLNTCSASTLLQTDGITNVVSLANQANTVLLNNGAQAFWFAGKTTNINVLCEGGVTNQFQFVSGVLSNVVAVP